MLGRNCCLPFCGSSESDKHKDVGIRFLQIPVIKSANYQEWKEKLVRIVEKYRVLSPTDYQRIEDGNMNICTRHFEDKDIYFTSK